ARDADFPLLLPGRRLKNLVTDAHGLSRVRFKHHDVGEIHWRFAFENAARDAALTIGPDMLLHHVHALHHDLALLGQHFDDSPTLAFVAPGDDDDLIVLFDFDS